MIDVVLKKKPNQPEIKELEQGDTFIHENEVFEITNQKSENRYICLNLNSGRLITFDGDVGVKPEDFIMLPKGINSKKELEEIKEKGLQNFSESVITSSEEAKELAEEQLEKMNSDKKTNYQETKDEVKKKQTKKQKSLKKKQTILQQKKENVKEMNHQEKKKFFLLEFLRKTCELKHWPKTSDINHDPEYYNWATFHNMLGSKSNICDIIRHKLIPKDDKGNNVHRQFLAVFVENVCSNCEHYEEGAACSEHDHPGLCFKEMVKKEKEERAWGYVGAKNNY